MKRAVKLALLAVAVIVLLLIAAVGYLIATFDANEYKPQLIAFVLNKLKRQLTIEGPLSFELGNPVTLKMGRATLKEADGKTDFASMSGARLALDIVALVRGKLIADSIEIDGLQLRVSRFADGSTNIDDLLPRESDPKFEYNIARLRLTGARITLDDEATARHIVLSNLGLSTSRIAEDQPGTIEAKSDVTESTLPMNGHLALTATYRFNLSAQSFELSSVAARFMGKLAAFDKLDLTLRGQRLARRADELKLTQWTIGARAQFGAKPLAGELTLTDVTAAGGKWSAGVIRASLRHVAPPETLEVTLVTDPWQGTLERIESQTVNVRLTWRKPEQSISATARAPIALDIKTHAITAKGLRAETSVERKTLRAQASLAGDVAGDWSRNAWRATGMKFELTGATGAIQLNASGRATANAEISARTIAASIDLLDATLRADTTVIGARLSGPMSLAINGDALKADLGTIAFDGRAGATQLSGNVKATIAADLARQSVRASPFTVQLQGVGESLRLSTDASLAMDVDLANNTARAGGARVNVDARIDASRVSGKVRADIDADFSAARISAKSLQVDATIRNAARLKQPARAKASGSVEWGSDSVRWSGRATLDDSTLQGGLSVQDFSQPAYAFNLDIDRLDWDRYADLTRTSVAKPGAKTAAPPLDLKALRELKAKGELKIGWLKSGGIVAKRVKLSVD